MTAATVPLPIILTLSYEGGRDHLRETLLLATRPGGKAATMLKFLESNLTLATSEVYMGWGGRRGRR